jgi:integrase
MSFKIRFRKLSDGTQTVLLDIYRDGMKRQVESLPLRLTGGKKADKETLLTAEAIRMQRELDIIQVANGLKSLKTKDFNFIDYFRDMKKQKSKATAKVWQNTLNYLIDFAGEKLYFNTIDKDFAERFKKFMLGKVGSPNTANIYFSKFKACLNQAVNDGLIPANPITHVKNVSKVDTDRAYLTIEEVRALANTYCGNEEVKRAFLFACYTGLRLCDIRAITGANIVGNKLQFRQLKTKGVQYVELSTQALAILGNRLSLMRLYSTCHAMQELRYRLKTGRKGPG